MATPEGQATRDVMNELQAAVAVLNTVITITNAGGAAWDTATPAQRTAAVNAVAKVARATAVMLQGLPAPLGTARVPD